MRQAHSPPPRDPEFDRPPRLTGGGPGPGAIPYYQRLIVNPFLMVIVLLLTMAATVACARASGSDLAVPVACAGGLASLLVLQYHCLDCGSTGWFRHWRRHACPRVVERWRTPYSAASHLFPMPAIQLILWMFVLFGGWLLLASTSGR